MPRKPAAKKVMPEVPAQLDGQLALDAAFEKLEDAAGLGAVDWTSLEQFNLGELCDVLVRSDGGVMMRSADRGRAIALGVFVGGRSQWTTCRDQRELHALLDACVDQLVAIAAAARVAGPTPKARTAYRRS